ncbi:hypothetical protein METESE_02240 [Mesoterricola sediminis]|uniref:Uncharacterized protein n=1 Tax=Mesoterricola sediminis TaxID=2927980 RepID=A0AA48GLH3_9BACT|nr:hypothetical protein METESE_02240 [Mesoterricola sediminis]
MLSRPPGSDLRAFCDVSPISPLEPRARASERKCDRLNSLLAELSPSGPTSPPFPKVKQGAANVLHIGKKFRTDPPSGSTHPYRHPAGVHSNLVGSQSVGQPAPAPGGVRLKARHPSIDLRQGPRDLTQTFRMAPVQEAGKCQEVLGVGQPAKAGGGDPLQEGSKIRGRIPRTREIPQCKVIEFSPRFEGGDFAKQAHRFEPSLTRSSSEFRHPVEGNLAPESTPPPVRAEMHPQDVPEPIAGDAPIGRPDVGGIFQSQIVVSNPLQECSVRKSRQGLPGPWRRAIAEPRNHPWPHVGLGMGVRFADDACPRRHSPDGVGGDGVHQGHVLPGEFGHRVLPALGTEVALANASIPGLDLDPGQGQGLEQPSQRIHHELLVEALTGARMVEPPGSQAGRSTKVRPIPVSIDHEVDRPPVRSGGIQFRVGPQVVFKVVGRGAFIINATIAIQPNPAQQLNAPLSGQLANGPGGFDAPMAISEQSPDHQAIDPVFAAPRNQR